MFVVIQYFRNCSEQKLARQEGGFFFFFYEEEEEEMSFQVSLEIVKRQSIPDRGGKFIPPARNGE